MSLKEHLKSSVDERFNFWTHVFGTILALTGGVLLLYYASEESNRAILLPLVIYILASVLVFGSSSIYHAVPPGGMKRKLQKLDHISIFFMIAGTHTPIVVHSFESSFADYYLIVLWLLVVLGVVYKLFWIDRYEKLGLALYIILGWMAVFILPDLIEVLSNNVILLILGGGLAYTAGIIFYRWYSLLHHHAIWHIFVLIGAILHYLAIYLMILE